jgi:hypothetical protein
MALSLIWGSGRPAIVLFDIMVGGVIKFAFLSLIRGEISVQATAAIRSGGWFDGVYALAKMSYLCSCLFCVRGKIILGRLS